VVNCLNQDFQDFRIYRMRYSVVNCLNQDLQDEVFGG
jgi:hypothetical protein